jgi:hypothetical protein
VPNDGAPEAESGRGRGTAERGHDGVARATTAATELRRLALLLERPDRPPQHVPAGPAAAGQATTTGQRPHPSRKVAQLWLCGKPLPAVPLRPACPGNRGRGRLGFCRYSDTASYLLNPHAILPCDLN